MKLRSAAFHTPLMLFLLLLISPAFAGEVSTVINGKSFHVGSKESWNEKNYGVGLEYQFDTQSKWKSILMANAFRDSHNNMSYMAGGGLHRNLYSSDRFDGLYVDLGVNVFLMTRVGVNNGRAFPGALPSMTVGNRYMGVNLTYLPKLAIKELTPAHSMDRNMKGVVFLQFKVNVKQLLGFR